MVSQSQPVTEHACEQAATETPRSDELSVATAAIRIGEAVFTLPRPNRHHNIMWWLHVLGIPSGQMHDQGFVLTSGCYVDRESAAHFAKQAGQVGRLIAPPQLYSEDLWDGGADLPRMEQIAALAGIQNQSPLKDTRP